MNTHSPSNWFTSSPAVENFLKRAVLKPLLYSDLLSNHLVIKLELPDKNFCDKIEMIVVEKYVILVSRVLLPSPVFGEVLSAAEGGKGWG